MEKIINYIFAVICLTGCLLQIYKISDIYFSYETTTDVRYYKESIISLPAVTICARKYYFASENVLKLIFNNYSIDSSKKQPEIMNYLNKLNIKEQFQTLNSAQKILTENCTVLRTKGFNSSENYLKCDKISSIRMSIGYNFVCATIFSQVNGEADDKYSIDLRKFNNLFYLIGIRLPNYVKQVVLYIHSRSETFYSRIGKSNLRISYNESEYIEVNYEKTIVELMPKPYSTACVDYKQFGYNLRSDCIFECESSFFKNKMNLWPKYFHSHDSESDLLMTDLSKNLSFNTIPEKKCEKTCGLENDCKTEYFIPEYIRIPKETYNRFTIDVRQTRYPILSIKHSPKIQFE